MRRSILFAFAVAFALSGAALATPITDPGGKGPLRWPDGTVIKVYIPKDPRGGDRDQQIADGISSWNDVPALKEAKVMYMPVIGDPPKDAGNGIVVTWTPNKPKEKDGKEAVAVTHYENTGSVITSASMEFWDNPNFKADDDDIIALAAHEGGHALGINHNTTDDRSVMRSPPKFESPSGEDKREAADSYTAEEGHSQVNPSVKFEDGLWHYRYDLQYQDGTELALFQVDIGDAILSDVLIADGWRLDDFSLPLDVTHTAIGPSQTRFVSFILADENSYLGPGRPHLSFGFTTNAAPGLGEAYLNGLISTQVPTSVPEPATWASMLAGLGAIGFAIRRKIECRFLRNSFSRSHLVK